MKRLTVDDVLKYNPCHDKATLKKYLPPGRKALTNLEIFELQDVPINDRLWVGFHYIGNRNSVEIACEIARDVLPIFAAKYPEDKRPERTIKTAEKCLRGEISASDAVDAVKDADDADAVNAATAVANVARAASCVGSVVCTISIVRVVDAAATAADAADAANAAEYKQACLDYLAMRILENEL